MQNIHYETNIIRTGSSQKMKQNVYRYGDREKTDEAPVAGEDSRTDNGGQTDADRKSPTWEMEYLTFPMLDELPCIRHLFTTRRGGVSKGIFESLNLSFTRGDDKNAVLENFSRVAAVLGTERSHIVCSDQTHTTNVRVVTREDMGKGIEKERDYTDVDGLITREKGVVLATFYADCVPLYFVDPVKEVIALSHSGWKGTAGRIGEVTVRRMQQEFGCRPENIYAAIGPSICKDCYEVSEDVARAFKESFKQSEFLSRSRAWEQIFTQKDERQKAEGKYQLDLHLANKLILLGSGILPQHLAVTDICTAHNPDYLFSHRKTDGKRGNLGAFLYLL